MKDSHLPLATRHCPCLALTLFVFGVFADHPDHPFAFDDLTLIANLFYGCSYFHRFYFSRKTILPRVKS
jgi:hypothetical protein